MIQKLLFVSLFFSAAATAQTTLIPDARFERALIELGIDTDQTLNGQMATQDALAVTSLEISEASLPNYPYTTSSSDFYDGLIHDFTGLEAFANLEQLTISSTMAEQINLNGLVRLKHLEFGDNMLTSVDVSNNPLLETFKMSNGGDVYPFNGVGALDFSHNPNINYIIAYSVSQVNLNNQNNLENMFLNVGCFCWGFPDVYGTVCVQVDNPSAAINNQWPYSTWTVYHSYTNVHFTSDAALCVLGNETFKQKSTVVYPNPVSNGLLYFKSTQKITGVAVYDALGRKVLERSNPGQQLEISNLAEGSYFVNLQTSGENFFEQILVKK